MKKLVTLLLVIISSLQFINAQPTVLGTQLVNGSYVTYNLLNRGAVVGIQLQATSGATSGSRNWEFATGTASATNYSTNWRPYTSGQTLSGFNVEIDPSTDAASARYNSASGGQSGLLPAITANNYYTVIVGTNASSNNFMSILETTFNPRTITNVADNYTSAGTAVTVTITLSGALQTGEYLYIRYTTDAYATNTNTTVAPVITGSNPYTVVIPGTSVTGTANNSYYVFTSNSSTTPTNSNADYLTLNLGNNSNSNYPLPVELTTFTAALNNSAVELNWNTATEVNNYGFDVEREATGVSSQNTGWEKVGFVKGAGNSNSPKNYSFIDNTVSFGSYSYRLKQIDNDGTYKYSDVVEVNAGQFPNGFVLNQNYPNPFNPATLIQFGVNKNTHASLVVYNILGAEVASLFNGNVTAGQIYNVSFNGNNLASGIYYYKLQTNEKTEVKKMLLMK